MGSGRVLRTLQALCACAVVVWTWAGVGLAPVAAPDTPFGPVIAFEAIAALPVGFTLPPPDASTPVRQLLTADIDADGDLDVVAASDHGLELSVWVNDGTGQLTRKRPSRDRTWAAVPLAPSLDARDTNQTATIQTQASPLDTPGGSQAFSRDGPASRLALRPHLLRCRRSAPRPARAPPALPLFA